MGVTPRAGVNSIVLTSGTAVKAADGNIAGGYIVNPVSEIDQSGGNSAADVLYVDPVGPCGDTRAGGTIIALQPGERWDLIPGQSTETWVNSRVSGHRFVVVVW